MADLIEPGRSYHGIAELRELAQVDLKLAMLESIDQTFIFLERKKVPVHQGMVACRKWLTETDFGHRIDRPEQNEHALILKGDPNEQ
jgi:HD superfamily phosphohydrolase YqeK